MDILVLGCIDYHGNAGFITLGTSRETSACVCDAIALAWQEGRAEHYPYAQQILLISGNETTSSIPIDFRDKM